MGLVEFTYDKEKYKEVIKEFPYEDEVDAIFIVNGKLLGGEYYKGRILEIIVVSMSFFKIF